MTTQNPLVSRYVRQLEAELDRAGVPPEERRDILRDIASHAVEAAHSGQSIAAILEQVGPARELARSYASALHLLPAAKEDASLADSLVTTVSRAGAVCASLLLVLIMGAVGLGLTLAGAAAVCGGIVLPFLPDTVLDPTLRRGLPEIVTIVVGVVFLVVGLLSLRLVRINFRMVVSALRHAAKEKRP